MKSTFVLLGVSSLIAAGAFAQGSDIIIRERAKELRNQNNVRQGVPPPTQPAQPTQPNAASTPAPQPQSLVQLQTDLAAIKTDSPVTAQQKQKLAGDLIAAAQGAKPSAAAVTKLAEDLSAAFATKPLSAAARARLAQELDAVLNPGKYPQANMPGIFADIQAVFQENGLERKRAVAIADDVKALAPK